MTRKEHFLLCSKSFEANLCHVPRKHIHLSDLGTEHQESQSQRGPEPVSKAPRKHTGAARGPVWRMGQTSGRTTRRPAEGSWDSVRALMVRALQAQWVETLTEGPGRPAMEEDSSL